MSTQGWRFPQKDSLVRSEKITTTQNIDIPSDVSNVNVYGIDTTVVDGTTLSKVQFINKELSINSDKVTVLLNETAGSASDFSTFNQIHPYALNELMKPSRHEGNQELNGFSYWPIQTNVQLPDILRLNHETLEVTIHTTTRNYTNNITSNRDYVHEFNGKLYLQSTIVGSFSAPSILLELNPETFELSLSSIITSSVYFANDYIFFNGGSNNSGPFKYFDGTNITTANINIEGFRSGDNKMFYSNFSTRGYPISLDQNGNQIWWARGIDPDGNRISGFYKLDFTGNTGFTLLLNTSTGFDGVIPRQILERHGGGHKSRYLYFSPSQKEETGTPVGAFIYVIDLNDYSYVGRFEDDRFDNTTTTYANDIFIASSGDNIFILTQYGITNNVRLYDKDGNILFETTTEDFTSIHSVQTYSFAYEIEDNKLLLNGTPTGGVNGASVLSINEIVNPVELTGTNLKAVVEWIE